MVERLVGDIQIYYENCFKTLSAKLLLWKWNVVVPNRMCSPLSFCPFPEEQVRGPVEFLELASSSPCRSWLWTLLIVSFGRYAWSSYDFSNRGPDTFSAAGLTNNSRSIQKSPNSDLFC
eukprot:scaffold4809_cov116-Cylindrotheca_fusiformis.AAC.8